MPSEFAARLKRLIFTGPFALALITLSTAALWLVGAPFLAPRSLPLGPAVAVLLAGCAPMIVRSALRAGDAHKHVRALLMLILLGASAQVCLHFVVPSASKQSLERISHGHGEFLRVAAARRGHAWQTLRDYDDLFAQGQLGKFAGSKPPGTLGVYMLLDHLAQARSTQSLLGPLLGHARSVLDPRRIPESAALGVVLFPLLTFLALVPLVWLARSLYGDARAGYSAALIGYASPAILLIDLHLDGSLYPGLALLAVALVAHATRARHPLSAFAGGVVATLGVYCTFGLLPVLGLGLGVALLPSIERLRARAAPRDIARPLVHALAFALGAGVALLLLVAVLDFQPARRFESALAFHAAWKRDLPTQLWRWLSLAEFALYLAPPLAAALLYEAGSAVRSLVQGRLFQVALCSLGLCALLLAMAVSQGTNEVARLWLFMVPFVALVVAGGLHARTDHARARQLAAWLCACQAGLAVLMKVTQGY